MKKQILLILLLIMFIPIIVNAETCDLGKISISSITIEEKTDSVEELDEPSANGKNINLNLSMSNVGDNIEYKIVVKNESDEDYELDKNSLNISSNYIDYTLKIEDNSNILKSKSSKLIYLKVEYKNEVPEKSLNLGKYNENKTVTLNLLPSNTIINPKTGINLYILLIVLIILISYTINIIFRKNKSKKIILLLIGVTIIIPITVNAICKVEIKVDSNITIKDKKINPCTFNGSLEEGAEYINGSYTYRYMQHVESINDNNIVWSNFPDTYSEGWGVIYNNNEQNNKQMCSSINGLPIVSMRNTYNSKDISKVDLSRIYTSQVEDMSNMFSNILDIEEIDLSSFDTSNVKNMSGMFYWNYAHAIDLSSFNTSKVTDMSYMFSYSEVSNPNIRVFDTSNVKNMSGMFWNCKSNRLDLSSFNTSNVVNMSGMFSEMALQELDLSNFDISNVNSMGGMFYNTLAPVAYARTQEDADRFNAQRTESPQIEFVVRRN